MNKKKMKEEIMSKSINFILLSSLFNIDIIDFRFKSGLYEK